MPALDERNGAGSAASRPQWWWCVPVAVTLIGLPVLLFADWHILADLWFGNCEHDDNSCDGPYTEAGKLRAKAVTWFLAAGQIAAFSAMWGTAKSRKAKVRARQALAHGALVAAPVAAGAVAWIW